MVRTVKFLLLFFKFCHSVIIESFSALNQSSIWFVKKSAAEVLKD